MTVTDAVRATVARAMREKSISHLQIASVLDVSPAWVTKFFNGKLQSLTDTKVRKLEEFLGVKFFRLVEANPLPAEAVALGRAMKDNPALAEIVGGLAALIKAGPIWELPFFETEELREIGETVTTIVHKWEEPRDPHYGRIGREVVELLSKLCARKEKEREASTPPPEKVPTAEEVENVVKFWISRRGGVAAGEQMAYVEETEIPVAKDYPEGHYALKVFGHSMEPTIPDGSTIIVKEWATSRTPKKGSIVVYSDASGSSLKVFGYRKAKRSDDPELVNSMGDVAILTSLNKAFPDVATMEGGKIDAVFVEVLG